MLMFTAPPWKSTVLTTVHVTALAMTTATGRWLRTRYWAECRTAIVTIVEAALGAVTITSTCHFYVIAICTNGADREKTYCTETHQSNRQNQNLFLHNLRPKLTVGCSSK